MDDKAIGSGYGQSSHIIGVPPSKVVYALEQILSEWKRVEDDKSLWQYQRSELLSKMAAMQAQQLQHEKEKLELQKRIKILEYGLKVERARACANSVSQYASGGSGPTGKTKKTVKRHYCTLPVKLSVSGESARDLMAEYLSSADGRSTDVPLSLASKHLRKDGKMVRNVAEPEKKQENKSAAHEQKGADSGADFTLDGREGRSETVISSSGRPVPKNNNFTETYSNTVVAVGSRQQVKSSMFEAPKDEADTESTAVGDSTTARIYANAGAGLGASKSRNKNKDTDEDEESNVKLPSITNSSIFTPPTDLPDYKQSDKVSQLATKTWKPKLVLRNHMDSVRCVSFDVSSSSGSVLLGSASEDGTAKLWNLSQPLHPSNERKKINNIEPLHTFRGHRSMVTGIAVKSASSLVVTTGTDSQCILWDMPPLNVDTYAGHGQCSVFKKAALLHTGAVWAAAIAPGDESPLIYTACSDENVYIWKNSASTTKPSQLVSAATYNNENNNTRIPCSVVVSSMDNSKLFVGYTSGEIACIDVETARIVNLISDASSNTQITQLSAHPYASCVLAAHADNTIRQYDLNSNRCYNVIPAHQDCATSVSFYNDGLIAASAGHDQSIRIWELSSKKIIQSLDAHQTHRSRFDEAIHSVHFHPKMPVLASGGADSVVKIYT